MWFSKAGDTGEVKHSDARGIFGRRRDKPPPDEVIEPGAYGHVFELGTILEDADDDGDDGG